ncbi:hypothetical protein LTR36_003399 [Oleoguttula mirabilis]|uniref:Uncharacterized protein n=1 Tax=Oleoguttula mirabilis TaxID=1507867 RepID=A0AAV9JJT3_9PEZI|nr:hypothetical protein LTR36_003399 [Oleoguttula mirabilis]
MEPLTIRSPSTGTSTWRKSVSLASSLKRSKRRQKQAYEPFTASTDTTRFQLHLLTKVMHNRRFSGDESFLKDPNAFNDTANTLGTNGAGSNGTAISDGAGGKGKL